MSVQVVQAEKLTHAQSASCPQCAAEQVGRIRFDTLGPGMSFQYCRRCEHRWWVRGDDHQVALSDVLHAATTMRS